MSAAPARFTFDLDLARGHGASSFVNQGRLDAQLQDARMAGYGEGFAAGEQGALAASAQGLAAAAAALAASAARLLADIDPARAETERQAIELAASVARKLAADLVAQQPAAELDALLADCLTSLDGVPHLVIRCHPELADALRELAAGHIATSGYTGRLIVIGEPERAMGDGRIEWADGGLVRDTAAIQQAIDEKIAAYIAARRGGRTEEPA